MHTSRVTCLFTICISTNLLQLLNREHHHSFPCSLQTHSLIGAERSLFFGGQSLPGLLFCFVFYFSLSFFPFSYSLSGKTTDPSPAIQSTKQTFQLFVIDPEPDCSPTHPLTQPRQAATSLVSAGVVYSSSALTSTSTNYG